MSSSGLALTANGWTDFEALISTGYSDARVVFVSETGDDGTGSIYDITDLEFDSDGMFQPTGAINPYLTLAAANANMREGFPDILLLNRGDTWVDQRFTTGNRIRSGRSATERSIVASYGTGARPQLTLNGLTGFDLDEDSYIIVSGIRVYGVSWLTAGRAIDVRGTGSDILFENMKADQVASGIVQGGALLNIVIRRCVFTEHEAHDGMFYAYQTTNMVFEENIFYKPYDDSYPDESRYGRHLYLNPGDGIDLHNLDVKLYRNIFYSSERTGIDGRAGGIYDNNLMCKADMRFGANGGSGGSVVYGEVTNNVFTETSDNINVPSELFLVNAIDTLVQGNIFTNTTTSGGNTAILVTGDGSYTTYIAKNIDILDNKVYGWFGTAETYGIWFNSSLGLGNPGDVEDIVIEDNDVQMTLGSNRVVFLTSAIVDVLTSVARNKYFSTDTPADWFVPGGAYADWAIATGDTSLVDDPDALDQVVYPDPGRTIASYNLSLGGISDSEAFMDGVVAQSRQSWDARYSALAVNNYIREGFGVDPIDPPSPEEIKYIVFTV